MLRSILENLPVLLLATTAVSAQSSQSSSHGLQSPTPKSFTRPTNVLVILCDQLNVRMMGHEGSGFGGVGQSLTPNLDDLAQEGVRFANASCATASCQPSRYTILTGRWAHHHGVRSNLIWEPRTETTFPELARPTGYATATIGKHHLFWIDQPPAFQDDHGFEEIVKYNDYVAYSFANGMGPYNLPSNTAIIPNLAFPFDQTGATTNSNALHPAGYLADETIRFLEERAGPGGDGRPFICWYSMYGPHTPILPSGVAPDNWAHLYDAPSLALAPNIAKVATTSRLAMQQALYDYLTPAVQRQILAYYDGLVSQIDWNIGRVLQRLDELGLADDTLVLFTTDHGEMASEMGCWNKGAGSYDALTRVPLIARLPGVLPAGRVITEPVNNIDIFPTLVEVTGVPISNEVRSAVDGVSLLDLMIQDEPPADWRQETFHEFGAAPQNRQFMVRTPTAKLVVDDLDGTEEFYDLENDPFEITNLIDDPNPGIQALIADLRNRYVQWFAGGVGHAPFYSMIGPPAAGPSAPSGSPIPANGATSVSRQVDPSWRPCPGTAFQNVYFGTNADPPLFARLGHMDGNFNPGSLDASTTYYWRVEFVNANGQASGPVWSFTTEPRGAGGPPLATSSAPGHLESDVALGVQLGWTVGPGTTLQDVYFGLADNLQLVASGLDAATTTWDPGPLSAGLTYEWRIDGTDAEGTTEGDVWRFTTSSAGLAQRAEGVYPVHLDKSVAGGASLQWTAGAGSVSHDVYFGTSFPLTFQRNQTGTHWNPGPLVSGEVYYWRIDEVNAFGTTVGWTWRFVAE